MTRVVLSMQEEEFVHQTLMLKHLFPSKSQGVNHQTLLSFRKQQPMFQVLLQCATRSLLQSFLLELDQDWKEE